MTDILENDGLIHEFINPGNVARADIAVFIPSYEEGQTIELPVRKVAAGLKKFYPEHSSVIVNCDNNSGDNTREAFFAAECEVPRIYASTKPGVRGKGANLANAFKIAARLSAKAVALIDANITSIKSGWIQSLLDPIINGSVHYVTPIYGRHRYDAPLTRGLIYPLTRCLFGRRVFQPISVDHAFSGQVNDIFMDRPWVTDDRGYKSDLAMLSTITARQIPICQSVMGHPRVTTLGKLDHDLPKAFTYTVRAAFDLMAETAPFWTSIKRSRPTILFGADQAQQVPPPIVLVDRDYLTEGFIKLGRQYRPVWESVFSPGLNDTLNVQLNRAEGGSVPVLESEMWRGAIWEASAAWRDLKDGQGEEVAASLCPLFFAKELAVHLASEKMSGQQFRAMLENEAMAFESAKGGLVSLWNVGGKND